MPGVFGRSLRQSIYPKLFENLMRIFQCAEYKFHRRFQFIGVLDGLRAYSAVANQTQSNQREQPTKVNSDRFLFVIR